MAQGRAASRDQRIPIPRLCNALTGILGTALAEAAAEEGRRNPHFASEVRRRYNELSGLQGSMGKRAPRRVEQPLEPLVPIRRIEGQLHIDPFAPLDPERLAYIYGRDKLARALQEYTVDTLKQAAARLEQRHPGTKPTNRGRKDPLIAYIVPYSGTSD